MRCEVGLYEKLVLGVHMCANGQCAHLRHRPCVWIGSGLDEKPKQQIGQSTASERVKNGNSLGSVAAVLPLAQISVEGQAGTFFKRFRLIWRG